ncbi:MAG: Ig-like domain-containing protein, partial [Nitrosomonas sp.]|nr:Ig-like domain-containing protein [Nitrosomonas sp.]
ASGNRVIDPSGHPDTSFLVRMPANTPYLMQGVDCNGRTLNTDQTWQSLRPGEQKTCGGCHVHSKPTRITFAQSFAATPAYVMPRLGEGTVPLLAGKSGETVQTRAVPGYGMRIEFTRDIKPIFDQRCIACHGGGSPAAGLDLSLTNVANNNVAGTTWHKLIADRSGKFRRPQLTRYVRAFNSRGSLLYWKAANQRTDNRTDGQYADDIDFGAAHPTSITADELGLLSRWIDIGAPGGAQELKDTQKPTLHLAIAGNSGSLSQLRVGTVDLGSGIDPGSLRVCVLGSDGACSNRAGAAEKHGVTLVDLGASLSDPNTEIYASVRDLAGNTTEVYRSVGWFLNSGSVNIGNAGTDTQAPKISITSPLSGAVSGVVPVTFSYSDNTAVVSVDFYVNGALYSTSAQAPFALSLDATKLASGSYTLSAIAFDAERNQGVSNSVIVTVSNGSTTNGSDTQSPVISIASPIAGSTVSGNIPVSFSYADNVAVTAVDLYLNGQPYGKNMQAPFTFALDSTKLTNGTHTLAAHAFDAAGNKGVSASVSIAVSNTVTDTQAPVISIASPMTGSAVSGNIPVSFSYADNVAVTAVDFYVNGQLHGKSTQAPFTFALDTKKLTNGTHTLTAHAFDAASNKGVSGNATINVDNASAKDAEAPSVNIISPVNGQIVSGPIQIAVDASDNVGVSYVDFHINGNLVARDRSAPYQFSLNGRFMMKGNHVLTARAYDAAGNQGVSPNVTITVK